MNPDYPQDLASAYADGVRSVLFGGPAEGAERGAAGVADEAAVTRAEALLPVGAQLNDALSAQLVASDADSRLDAATRLLAKTLADLEITGFLATAEPGEGERGGAAERSASVSMGGVEDYLGILTSRAPVAGEAAMRGGEVPLDLASARQALLTGVDDALDLIAQRAARAGQTALGGVLGIGVAELAQAAALVGTDVATALGQGAAATRVIGAITAFAGQATDGLTALLGPSIAQAATQQVVTWVDALRTGSKFAEVVDKLYDTPTTVSAVGQLVSASTADAAHFGAALTGVDALDAAYTKQVELAEKILGKLRYLSLIPAVALPQGRLVAAAAYLLVAGYIVLCGADFVDSPRITLLKRVPGVRDVVATNLGGPAPAA